jgi:hypothetical protein
VSRLVWSEKDFVLADAAIVFPGVRPVGTSGRASPVLYWLDDDADDVAKYIGHRVQVIGMLDEAPHTGQIDIEEKDGVVEAEVDFDGREAQVRIPRATFGAGPIDAQFDLLVRSVDVRAVTVLSAPCR